MSNKNNQQGQFDWLTKQQDPIDFLIQNLSGHGFYLKKDQAIIKQAKEMYKQKIIDAWNEGHYEDLGPASAEQYYNETTIQETP
jgi:hypothetical protein